MKIDHLGGVVHGARHELSTVAPAPLARANVTPRAVIARVSRSEGRNDMAGSFRVWGAGSSGRHVWAFTNQTFNRSVRCSMNCLPKLRLCTIHQVAQPGAAAFVGRRLELAVLRRALDEAIDGRGGPVLLAAEAG